MSEQAFQFMIWLVNGLFAIIGAFALMWIKHQQEEIKDLRAAKHQQASELAALRILVAGDYLTREEFRELMREMTQEVRGGFNDLHKKVDSGLGELYDELRKKV